MARFIKRFPKQMVCRQCKNKSKYKCPKTQIRYCSVSCFKSLQKDIQEGKAKPVTLPEKIIRNPNPPKNMSKKRFQFMANPSQEDTWHKYDHEDDRLPEHKLNLLGKSDELKKLLANPHLRQVCTFIDTSKNKDRGMEQAMQEPIFVEFADACLKLVESESEGEEDKQKDGFVEVKEFDLIQF